MTPSQIIALAASYDGLSCGTDPERYAALLFPTDNAVQARLFAASMSSCGLFIRALLALLGVDGNIHFLGRVRDVLRDPYASMPEQAVALLIALAQARGVWNTRPTPADIQPGVVVIVDGPVHVMLCVEAGTDFLSVPYARFIQGGGEDVHNGGLPTAIHTCNHPIEQGGGRLVFAGRPVLGIFDASALPCVGDPGAA
jgi:hypothetical protein